MSDEVIRDVRRIRHRISQECDHDVHKVVAYYRAFQNQLKESGKYRFANPSEWDVARTSDSDVNPSAAT